MAGQNYYWRAKNRYAPHNAYTRSDNLNQAEKTKEWSSEKFNAFTFADAKPDEVGIITEVTIPYLDHIKLMGL